MVTDIVVPEDTTEAVWFKFFLYDAEEEMTFLTPSRSSGCAQDWKEKKVANKKKTAALFIQRWLKGVD